MLNDSFKPNIIDKHLSLTIAQSVLSTLCCFQFFDVDVSTGNCQASESLHRWPRDSYTPSLNCIAPNGFEAHNLSITYNSACMID